jgi:opacity protein-like surface antigen
MMRTAIYLFASAIILTSNISLADDIKGFYVKADAGASIPKAGASTPKRSKASFKTTPVYNLGVGYHFNDVFRTDLNLQYRPLTLKNSLFADKATNYSVVLNGYLNLSDSKDDVIPYLTAGIGYGKNKLSSSTKTTTTGSITGTIAQSGKTTSNIIFNAGAGITVAVIDNLRVDIGYRYYRLGKLAGTLYTSYAGAVDVNSTNQYKIKSLSANEITAGLTYKF